MHYIPQRIIGDFRGYAHEGMEHIFVIELMANKRYLLNLSCSCYTTDEKQQ